MSDSFKDRGQGFEAKFKLDQEQAFRATSRRNRLLGEWLAGQFGMSEADAKEYAKTVVAADLEEPGDEDVMRKVMADIAARKVAVSEQQVRQKLVEFHEEAARQIAQES